MATATTYSTPQSQISKPIISTPSPGSWRHPNFDEIVRRQRANIFSESNARRIAWNGGTLIALAYSTFSSQVPRIITNPSLRAFTSPTLLVICLVLCYNIAVALLPLFKTNDDLTDIPLTPTQRALLGLDPNATPPPTPGTNYITPPRYPYSPTPRSVSPARRSLGNTPQSRKASPSFGRDTSDSPSSPSPLWQKTMSNGRDTLRRSSYGTPSPLGSGTGNDRSVLGAPNTPSPSTGRGTTVGLNNKWLFDKGRRNSGGRSVYS